MTHEKTEIPGNDISQQIIAESVRTILHALGEDPTREGLLKTPDRYANALLFFTKGYEESLSGKLSLLHGVCLVFIHEVLIFVFCRARQ